MEYSVFDLTWNLTFCKRHQRNLFDSYLEMLHELLGIFHDMRENDYLKMYYDPDGVSMSNRWTSKTEEQRRKVIAEYISYILMEQECH